MKICDLTQFYSPVSGGVKRYIFEKKQYLQRLQGGDEHVLIIPGARSQKVEDMPGCRIYEIASPLISKTSRYRALLNLNAVEEILETERPDVIESGDPYQMAWKAIASGKALRIPTVGFYHSHFPEAYLRTASKFLGQFGSEVMMDMASRYVSKLYSSFNRTCVPSEALRQVLEQWGVENTVTIHLGVNTEVFCPEPEDRQETRKKMGLPEDAFVLLYVGRLAVEKNTRTLFQAFSQLRGQDGMRLVIVGDGNQRGLVEALKAEGHEVTWLPYCGDSAELAKIYRMADLFVHPGILETFGLVTLESQACGVPVVGIRGSYMDRIIYNDQQHWAAENSPEALARAIMTMRSQNLRVWGKEAAEKVREKYTWEQVFSRLFTVYREAQGEYPAKQ